MPQKNISFGITAFLDVLGFADRVLNATTTGDIDAIVAHIQTIQKEFDFKPKDDSIKEIHAYLKKTVLAFSDSVVVNVPLQSDMTDREGTFDPLMHELSEMASAQARCVNAGFFLRGGVDEGWWYRRGATLVSQSLVKSYKMEGLANVPVIALGDDLYEYLSTHSHRKFYTPDVDPLKLLRQYNGKGPNGKVSFWYLDYISIYADSIDWQTSRSQHATYLKSSPGERQQIVEEGLEANLTGWFTRHARSIEQAHALSKSTSVKEKYLWLASYHNEIAPHYSKSPVSLCNPK